VALWHGQQHVEVKQFCCGYCGANVASERGWEKRTGDSVGAPRTGLLRVCPNCLKPTFFDHDGSQTPGARHGSDVPSLPAAVAHLYDEARNCMRVSAFTCSVLASRKLLMNLAVTEGAALNLNFFEYVEFLAQGGHVPPKAKSWIDHIRRSGNEATHEIAAKSKDEAELLLDFVEMLLQFVYGFPSRVPTKGP